MESGYIMMPSTLTAENCAKGMLSGEFHESIEIENPGHCGVENCVDCQDIPRTILHKIPISWSNATDELADVIEDYAKMYYKHQLKL